MEKDFSGWHIRKSELNAISSIPFFHEREVWFCYLGMNIGSEEDGSIGSFLRPVLILRKFENGTFFGVPLTRTPRFGRYYFTVDHDNSSFAMLAQGRIIDGRRLSYRSGIMPEEPFENLRADFLAMFDKKIYPHSGENGVGPEAKGSDDPTEIIASDETVSNPPD
jgi:mRNA interferase MazF